MPSPSATQAALTGVVSMMLEVKKGTLTVANCPSSVVLENEDSHSPTSPRYPTSSEAQPTSVVVPPATAALTTRPTPTPLILSASTRAPFSPLPAYLPKIQQY